MKLFKKFIPLALCLVAINMMATRTYASAVNDSNLLTEKTMPISVTGEKRNGSGTAVDYTYSGEKEFYTIVTADDNVYYLIIDNEKDTNNVYFLKEINDSDLNIKNNIPITDLQQQPTTPPTTSQTAKPETKPNYNLFILIGAVIAILIGYYVKIVKPKKMRKNEPKQTNEINTDQSHLEQEEYDEYDDDLEFEEQMSDTDS